MLSALRSLKAGSPLVTRATGAWATRLVPLPPFKRTIDDNRGLHAALSQKAKKAAFAKRPKNVFHKKEKAGSKQKRNWKAKFLMTAQRKKQRLRMRWLLFNDFGKKKVPPHYWDDRQNCLKYIRYLAAQVDYKPWTEVLGKDFIKHGGRGLLKKYNGHVMYIYDDLKLLKAPAIYNLKSGTPNNYYDDIENRKKVMNYLAKKLEYDKIEDWYKTTARHFYKFKVHRLLAHFGESPRRVVMKTFPEYHWKPEYFYDARNAKKMLTEQNIRDTMKLDVGTDVTGINFASLSPEMKAPFIKEKRKIFTFRLKRKPMQARGPIIYKMPLPFTAEADRVATPEEVARQFREHLSRKVSGEILEKLMPLKIEKLKEQKAMRQKEKWDKMMEEEQERLDAMTPEERLEEEAKKEREMENHKLAMRNERYYGVEAAGTRIFNAIPEIGMITSHKDFTNSISKVKTAEEIAAREEEVVSFSPPSSSSDTSSTPPPSFSLVILDQKERASLLKPIKKMFWHVLRQAPILSFVFRMTLRSMRFEFEASEERPADWTSRMDQQRAFLEFFQASCNFNTPTWYTVTITDLENAGAKEILELYDYSIAKMVMTLLHDKYPWVKSYFREFRNMESNSEEASGENFVHT